MTLMIIVVLELLVILYQGYRYWPRNRYEVCVKLTGGSVSIVEIRDWDTPLGKVNLVTGVIHGPCPPPSIRHLIAAAFDRGDLSGEMTAAGITAAWQTTKRNGHKIHPSNFHVSG